MLSRTEALHNKLSRFIDLGAADIAVLRDLFDRPNEAYKRGDDLVVERQPYRCGFVLLQGWAISYKTMADGKRQILSYLMPGDIVGLFAAVAPVAAASVAALDHVEVAPFTPDAIVTTVARAPRVGLGLSWVAAREQEILAEHLVNVGQRHATGQIAHLLLEFWARLQIRGLASRASFSAPITQADIADTLGLSVVHVNRTLRALREQGVLENRRHDILIQDPDRLQALAGFSHDFLLNHYVPETSRRRINCLVV